MSNKTILVTLFLIMISSQASAFCGFFAAKADSKLFNKSSRVVIARDGNNTVLTMENDYQGDPSEFAMIIPVPVVPKEGDIKIADSALIDYLDSYSSPRLVEYYDPNPCELREPVTALGAVGSYGPKNKSEIQGVNIEAKYSIGEYDILILSGKESKGLISWLRGNNYIIPDGAEKIIKSYLKQDMYFFVAKVNDGNQDKLGFSELRPLQISYKHSRFMLPIRLGMINANDPQELFVYLFTRVGRVETTNYRTVRLPTDIDVPLFVKNDFNLFYQAMFSEQVKKENKKAVFLEYAWNLKYKCDPCVKQPLDLNQLQGLGVFWIDDDKNRMLSYPVYLTRLHVRYDINNFPEDLFFQETNDQSYYQGRYVTNNPWITPSVTCKNRLRYDNYELPYRNERQAKNLAHLTGWKINEIRRKIKINSVNKSSSIIEAQKSK